jgi:hypothetical protein
MAVIQSLACQYKEEGKKEFLERNAKREWNQSRFIRGEKKRYSSGALECSLNDFITQFPFFFF